MNQIYAGQLKPGDRVDVDSFALAMGISRSPVREAVLELQRDGFLESAFHRPARVATFDASVIRDTFDLYGVLWSRATSTVAAGAKDQDYIAELGRLIDAMHTLSLPQDVYASVYQYRRRISHRGASRCLRTHLRAFRSFVPTSYRLSVPALLEASRRDLSEEFAAIKAKNPKAAAKITQKMYVDQAEIVIDDLQRKNIIE